MKKTSLTSALALSIGLSTLAPLAAADEAPSRENFVALSCFDGGGWAHLDVNSEEQGSGLRADIVDGVFVASQNGQTVGTYDLKDFQCVVVTDTNGERYMAELENTEFDGPLYEIPHGGTSMLLSTDYRISTHQLPGAEAVYATRQREDGSLSTKTVYQNNATVSRYRR